MAEQKEALSGLLELLFGGVYCERLRCAVCKFSGRFGAGGCVAALIVLCCTVQYSARCRLYVQYYCATRSGWSAVLMGTSRYRANISDVAEPLMTVLLLLLLLPLLPAQYSRATAGAYHNVSADTREYCDDGNLRPHLYKKWRRAAREAGGS